MLKASTHNAMPRTLDGLSDIAHEYDAFLIDLWGVIHDGSQRYPLALEGLQLLQSLGKPVVFLSNAPRKTQKAIANLTRLAIDDSLYTGVMTSGQATHDLLAASQDWGRHYYYLGPGKDEDVLSELPYINSDNPAQADFILNTGFEYDFQPEAEIEPLLQRLVSHKLPLLCANPDLQVVKQDGTRLLCAGWVAARYAQLGGPVTYVGKPYPLVYEQALTLLNHPAPSRVLAIGDNLDTDIKGAAAMQIDSLLITGGILKSEHGELPSANHLAALYRQTGSTPTFVATSFAP